MSKQYIKIYTNLYRFQWLDKMYRSGVYDPNLSSILNANLIPFYHKYKL